MTPSGRCEQRPSSDPGAAGGVAGFTTLLADPSTSCTAVASALGTTSARALACELSTPWQARHCPQASQLF